MHRWTMLMTSWIASLNIVDDVRCCWWRQGRWMREAFGRIDRQILLLSIGVRWKSQLVIALVQHHSSTERLPRKAEKKWTVFQFFSGLVITKFSNESSVRFHLLCKLVSVHLNHDDFRLFRVTDALLDVIFTGFSTSFLSPSIFHSIFHLEFFHSKFIATKALPSLSISLGYNYFHYHKSFCYQTKLTNRTENAKFSKFFACSLTKISPRRKSEMTLRSIQDFNPNTRRGVQLDFSLRMSTVAPVKNQESFSIF